MELHRLVYKAYTGWMKPCEKKTQSMRTPTAPEQHTYFLVFNNPI